MRLVIKQASHIIKNPISDSYTVERKVRLSQVTIKIPHGAKIVQPPSVVTFDVNPSVETISDSCSYI